MASIEASDLPDQSLFNGSLGFIPSPSDLFHVVPRLARHITAVFSESEDNTTLGWMNETSNAIIQSTGPPLNASAQFSPNDDLSKVATVFNLLGYSFQRLANFDGVFSYLASRWAFSTLIIAVVLNRAHVYASARSPLRLNWQTRLFHRLVPIALLLQQILLVLQAIRCQTGHAIPQLRFQNTEGMINRPWSSAPGFLHDVASRILFWQGSGASCHAVGMIPTGDKPTAFKGSSSLLFPLFLSLGLSQLFETVSSALQGRQPMAETGMTLFEHSLAFAEAITVVRTSVGVGLFRLPNSFADSSSQASKSSLDSGKNLTITVTRSWILDRLNVPPEVLVISLISCLSHLSSHVLGLFALQSRFRLINTAVWGLTFMSIFAYSFINFAQPSRVEDAQIIRYPTVCIIGFIPHLIIMIGIILCASIYAVAIISTILSGSDENSSRGSIFDRVQYAHNNMQVSTALSNIKLRLSEDFYTFLLKTGYVMLSAATEAVYFNEAVTVNMDKTSWLERARNDEVFSALTPKKTTKSKTSNLLQVSGLVRGGEVPVELQDDFAGGEAFGLIDQELEKAPDGGKMTSGYGRERKTTTNFNKAGAAAVKETGVGISQRGGRWHMSAKLMQQAVSLWGYFTSRFAIACMESIGGPEPPGWMTRLARIPVNTPPLNAKASSPKELEFWMMADDGELLAPKDGNVDVEMETRKRIQGSGLKMDLDSYLYSWFRNNGWWGDIDSSGDYAPNEPEDQDLASITSESSVWESDSAEDGARTPTQTSYSSRPNAGRFSREGTPLDEENSTRLAQLLDPKTLEDKQEAKLLSHHLRTPGRPLTRSQYNRRLLREKGLILTPQQLLSGAGRSQLSPEDEETLLEQIILSRRAEAQKSTHSTEMSWSEGGTGMGSGAGPQCAICRSSPRTVLVWPCRCLSLCEDCRMNLAWNNFGSCVCCRRDVVAYSRLFVP